MYLLNTYYTIMILSRLFFTTEKFTIEILIVDDTNGAYISINLPKNLNKSLQCGATADLAETRVKCIHALDVFADSEKYQIRLSILSSNSYDYFAK